MIRIVVLTYDLHSISTSVIAKDRDAKRLERHMTNPCTTRQLLLKLEHTSFQRHAGSNMRTSGTLQARLH